MALPAPPGIVVCYGAMALVGAALLWLIVVNLVWPVDDALTNAVGGIAGHDFIAFYSAGRLAARGAPADAYSIQRMIETYLSILSVTPTWTPWAYPPHVFLLVEPLGRLTPTAALAIWSAVIGGAAIAAVRIVSGSWRLAPLALLAPQTIVNLGFGQNGTISAALFAAIATLWTRAPILAGVALGALAYKPHLMLVPGLLALCLGAWRIVAAAAATAAALAAASFAAYGIDPWLAWAGAIAGQMQHVTAGRLPAHRLATIYVLVEDATARPALALAAHAIVAVAAFRAALLTWRRTGDLFARALALTIAALLLPPYAFDYDAAILLVPMAALATGGRAAPVLTDAGRRWMLALCMLPLLVIATAGTARFSPMAPLLAVMLALATLQLARADRAEAAPVTG